MCAATRTFHPPLQERSRATLDRICAAAARLLEERSWPQITVAEIVDRAGSSVGSFYARFEDKDALLDHLDERYTREVLELAARLARRFRDRELDLEALVRGLIGELVAFHRGSRGLIRALVLRARYYREPAYDERTRRMGEAVTTLLVLLAEHLPPGPGTQRRAALAFAFTFSALRDRILFPESMALPVRLTDAELAAELASAMLAQLRG